MDPLAELSGLAHDCGAARVLWNRRYEPASIEQRSDDQAGAASGRNRGRKLQWRRCCTSLGRSRPRQALPSRCSRLFGAIAWPQDDPPHPLPAPQHLRRPAAWPASRALDELGLRFEPELDPRVAGSLDPGSAAARTPCYGSSCRSPSRATAPVATVRTCAGTSRLSPLLALRRDRARERSGTRPAAARSLKAGTRLGATSQFLTEFGWREFAYHLLYHFPHTPAQPLRASYARFPWKSDPSALTAWQRGITGYPLVDAGMRQLWQTGWMHNRVRMVAASFLVKDLLQPGPTAPAGSGTPWSMRTSPAIPGLAMGGGLRRRCSALFPDLQSHPQATRFDPQGTYVRDWVPELARLPASGSIRPWAAPPQVLSGCGVRLGETYPHRLSITKWLASRRCRPWRRCGTSGAA